jgi:hypothetical protein
MAQCVLLTDREGHVVAEAGSARGTPLQAVLPVLTEEVTLTARLAEAWGEPSVLGLHHFQGGQAEVYTASAADLPFLLVVVTWQRPVAYSGVVWLFVRRAMQELRWILRGDGGQPLLGLTPAQAHALGLFSDEVLGETEGEGGGRTP